MRIHSGPMLIHVAIRPQRQQVGRVEGGLVSWPTKGDCNAVLCGVLVLERDPRF